MLREWDWSARRSHGHSLRSRSSSPGSPRIRPCDGDHELTSWSRSMTFRGTSTPRVAPS